MRSEPGVTGTVSPAPAPYGALAFIRHLVVSTLVNGFHALRHLASVLG